MKFHQSGIRIVFVSLAVSLGLMFSGCGEKIAIPEPSGDFSINQYTLLDSLGVGGPAVQLTKGWGFLFVLASDAVTKYDVGLHFDQQVTGLAGPTALCADENEGLLFVWEDGVKRVGWYDSSSLELLGSSILPDVDTAVAMTTNTAGVDQAGADSYLYLSDPVSGVIHRYAFSRSEGLSPFGILAHSEGAGARSVHSAAGLTTDSEGFLLVCDADTIRNWVIRFDGTPDATDTATDPDDPDPMRGLAALFDVATCEPPAASDFVLGNAAECQESGWVGGSSGKPGEFFLPSDVAVDGSGRIFVADTENNRIQIFGPKGGYELQFTSLDSLAVPTSLGVFDETSTDANVINFGAFVILTLKNRDQVYRYISEEHLETYNIDNPPGR